MNLQVLGELQRIEVAHHDALALMHGYLESAVPAAYDKWAAEFPILSELPGATLATSLRTLLWLEADNPMMAASTLTVVRTQNSSARLVGPVADPVEIRVLKRPLNHRTNLPVRCVQGEQLSMFGTGTVPAAWEPVIFWQPDAQIGVLGTAVLAGVSNVEDPNLLVVWAELPLPVVVQVTGIAADPLVGTPPAGDGFEDFFGAGEMSADPDA